jgi:lipopolysaccharide assembly LptE-like protein
MKTLGAAVAAVSIVLGSCGYHVAGRADLLPKDIKTISIPAFTNATIRYKLTDRMPEALAREFISRTRYHIVSDPNTSDVVLRGTLLTYTSFPTIFDPVTGRAAAVELHVNMQLSLVERATGKVLFSRPNYEVRDRYEISVDPKTYFEESDAALDRVSKQAAQQVVTSILDNF